MNDAIHLLHSRQHLGIRPGLDRVRVLLGTDEDASMPDLGHVIHVAGTKGKGSTVEFMRRLLLADGRSVGAFTSPFVRDPMEQITIGTSPVSAQRFADMVDRLQSRADLVGATGFEMLTAAAFHLFAEAGVEFSIVEVGVGGRDDATSALPSVDLSVLTPIGLDHQELLGHSIEAIAGHKAGILRPGTPGVVAVTDPGALAVIDTRAREIGAPLWHVDYGSEPDDTFSVRTPARPLTGLTCGMHGPFQHLNAATAITSVDTLYMQLGLPLIPESDVRRGLNDAFLPGRYETLSEFPHRIIADVAHNDLAAMALADALSREPGLHTGHGRLILVVGMRANHDPDSFLHPFAQLASIGLVATQPSTHRPFGGVTSAIHSFARIVAAAAAVGIPLLGTANNVNEAIEIAMRQSGPSDVICVCGSFTTVGDIDPTRHVE